MIFDSISSKSLPCLADQGFRDDGVPEASNTTEWIVTQAVLGSGMALAPLAGWEGHSLAHSRTNHGMVVERRLENETCSDAISVLPSESARDKMPVAAVSLSRSGILHRHVFSVAEANSILWTNASTGRKNWLSAATITTDKESSSTVNVNSRMVPNSPSLAACYHSSFGTTVFYSDSRGWVQELVLDDSGS